MHFKGFETYVYFGRRKNVYNLARRVGVPAKGNKKVAPGGWFRRLPARVRRTELISFSLMVSKSKWLILPIN